MRNTLVQRVRTITILVAGLAVNAADAALVDAFLIDVVAEISSGAAGSTSTAVPDISGSAATWQYDTSTGMLYGSGLYQSEYSIGLAVTLFTRDIQDLAVGNGSAASATSFTCTEGTFGGSAFANLCARYYWGDNGIDETTWSYGPGTTATRMLGGDDFSTGEPMQTLAMFDGMVGTLAGQTLVMSNLIAGTPSIEMTFHVVPVPAAAWLFGSALGLLGWMRRRRH